MSKFKLSKGRKPIYEYSSTKDKYEIFIKGKKIESFASSIRKRKPTFVGFIPNFHEAFMFQRNAREKNEPFDEKLYGLLREVERDLTQFRRIILETFRNYDSLSPFRVLPQRTYLYSGETASHIGQTGENTVTLLATDNSKRGGEKIGFVEEVTKWMVATGISNGLKVNNLTDRHFELSIIGKDGTDHNICDVGFGCSQVLPVLVAGISHGRGSRLGPFGSTLVIQEPEIHLHPNAQAALGSFFAHLSNSPGQVFLETHSDNLVLRMARHVALGDINPSDIRIFYVEDQNGSKRVAEVNIAEDGSFIPDWPGGFFPQRQSESFELARAAMKKQKYEKNTQSEFYYPPEKQ